MMAEVENHVLGADSIIRINPAVNLTVDVKENTVTASFENISGFNALLSGSFSVSDLDWLNNGIRVAGQITGASIDRMDVMLNWGLDFVGFDFSNLTINHRDSFQATISFTTGHSSSPPPIPEPSTMLLFGSGLAGLAAWRYGKTVRA
ncbi:MAG: PEP-CTERM sorting domain-containing protein [Nitrospirota bacterium]|nr:PEP-CTERM sorting domain-containing protein [Nitrospirota bacterium]